MNEKVVVTDLKLELINKISLYKITYFPEPYTYNKNKKNFLDLSNYTAKSDLKNTTVIDTSKFAK